MIVAIKYTIERAAWTTVYPSGAPFISLQPRELELEADVEKTGDGCYTVAWCDEADLADLCVAERWGAAEAAEEAYERAAEHAATKCGYGRDDQPYDRKDFCE